MFSRRRILSLWLSHLSTDRIRRQWYAEDARLAATPHPSPLVVFGKRGNVDLLTAVDATAERLGLHAGLALAQARAMHPALIAVPEDAAADARLLDTIADWCLRYTPLVAIDPPDGILLDIGGCAHLFGGEAKLRARSPARAWPAPACAAHAAIAATIGTAWAAARFDVLRWSDQPDRVVIIPTGGERDAIAPLAARRAAASCRDRRGAGARRPETHRRYRRPAARAACRTLRQRSADASSTARSAATDEPLCPRLPVAPYIAEQRFPEPIAREEDVLADRRTAGRPARRRRSSAAAKARAASSCCCSAPTARCKRIDGRHIAAGARSARRSAHCSSSGSPRSATRSTRASASTSRGFRCSPPNRCPEEQIGLGGGDDASRT